MLQVGNFLFAQDNMDALEMRTHFALWCVMGAPLILGKDLADFAPTPHAGRMTAAEFMGIVGNEELIAVDQDTLAVQGTNRTTGEQGARWAEVWAKPLASGAAAVLLMNAEGTAPYVRADRKQRPLSSREAAQQRRRPQQQRVQSSTHALAAPKNRTVTVTWAQIGLAAGARASVRDLWAKQELGTFTGSFSRSLSKHDNAMLKITSSP